MHFLIYSSIMPSAKGLRLPGQDMPIHSRARTPLTAFEQEISAQYRAAPQRIGREAGAHQYRVVQDRQGCVLEAGDR